MNRIEKISIARIVTDLIKADSVIDSREMALFRQVKSDYGLSAEALSEARFTTFADAVNNLCHLSKKEKEELMTLFRAITLADGQCNKAEALLMIALAYCFEGEYDAEMVRVQVPQQGLQLENSQVIYVESDFSPRVNEVMSVHYHEIENAMRLAGFEFAYIPQIAQTYRSTPPELFKEVISFLTPNLVESAMVDIQQQISSMTTVDFCKNHLCRKLHLHALQDTYPSLLVKVGESVSEDHIFANFLKLSIEDDVMGEIKQFMFRFTSMMNSEYSILRNVYNSEDRFVYSGVFKQLIDLCMMKEQSLSTILLDTFRQKIVFREINEELKVTRSEKALYVLTLAESITGGLNLNSPNNGLQLKKRDERMRRLMDKYARIYRMFGGDADAVPNLEDPTIRNPKIAKIKTAINRLGSKLLHPEEYIIQRNSDGLYCVNLDSSMIYCIDNQATPWLQSERWRRIVSM